MLPDETVTSVTMTAVRPASQAGTSTHDEGRFPPGTLLAGRYRIIGLLGQGGMGEVYRATDLTLGQGVALKFLPEAMARDQRVLERFHGEVRVARQVSHPNVCRVYDIGESDGHPFISMEYVDGEDLASLLRRIGRLPSDKALDAARRICAGLNAAHAQGVIHRDLKPQNIMMNKRGDLVIMDFGLAAAAAELTGPEARNGTPAYMSPEQLKGGTVTARSDIYALGLVLYELFTGRKPFSGETVAELLARQEAGELTSVTSAAPDVDPAVDRMIRRCLDPAPERRPLSPLSVSAGLPGGDPLAAALAAGETPSPELVAASGESEGLRIGPALALLCACFVFLFASVALKQRRYTMTVAPPTLAPEVVSQRALEHAAALGYPDPPADVHIAPQHRGLLMRYLRSLPGPPDWRRWYAAEAPVTYFIYTAPRGRLLISRPFGRVSWDNPPPDIPGMARLEVDGNGNLRNFHAQPFPPSRDPAATVPVDAIFRAAGLDRAAFTEVTPATTPSHASDVFRAWRGPHPGLPLTELTVEVAWWRGRVTYARFIWPWQREDGALAQPLSEGRQLQEAGVLFIGIWALAAAAVMARRNWVRNRADRRGALYTGSLRFLLGMIEWACYTHPLPTAVQAVLAFSAAAEQLAWGAAFWLIYLALEPAVRANWPHALITWNRVVAGKWRDPRVCADILTGAAAGLGIWVVFTVRDSIMDGSGVDTGGDLLTILGTRPWIGDMAEVAQGAVMVGLTSLYLLFTLRLLLRRDWLAAAAGAFVAAMFEGNVAASQQFLPRLAIYAAVFGAVFYLLLRYGLVVAMTTVFFLNKLGTMILGSDLKVWHAPYGLAIFALLGGLATLAFLGAIRRRPAGPDQLTQYG